MKGTISLIVLVLSLLQTCEAWLFKDNNDSPHQPPVTPNYKDLVYGRIIGNPSRCVGLGVPYSQKCGRCAGCSDNYQTFNPSTCVCDRQFRGGNSLKYAPNTKGSAKVSIIQATKSHTAPTISSVESKEDDLFQESLKSKTTDGSECIFPFIYNGEKHAACAPGTTGSSWCPTELMEDGITFQLKQNSWGRCRGRWLPNTKCGPRHPLPDGSPSQCDPNGENPCCNTKSGWCGNTREHCQCKRCIEYREASTTNYPTTQALPTHSSKVPYTRPWLGSAKCGPHHPLPDGGPAQCNPQGKHPCCNPQTGWCGNTQAHCTCKGCIDYKFLRVIEVPMRCLTSNAAYVEKCGKCAECPSNDCQKFDLETCKCHMKPECSAKLTYQFLKDLF